ncbi:hypothetical protein D3C75_1033520 [compost metagenome]
MATFTALSGCGVNQWIWRSGHGSNSMAIAMTAGVMRRWLRANTSRPLRDISISVIASTPSNGAMPFSGPSIWV